MSSRKSTNHGLHLWDPQDVFLRTEFNENTEKLDTEIKANEDRVAALGTALRGEFAQDLAAVNAALSGNISAVNGSLSGAIATNSSRITAALGEMRWVKLLDQTLAANTAHWTINVSGMDFYPYMDVRLHMESSATSTIFLRVNGIATKTYGYAEPGYGGSLEDRLVMYEDPSKYVYRVSLLAPTPGKNVFAEVERGLPQDRGQMLIRGCVAPVKWSELRTLDLMPYGENNVVPAGTRVILTGMRK